MTHRAENPVQVIIWTAEPKEKGEARCFSGLHLLPLIGPRKQAGRSNHVDLRCARALLALPDNKRNALIFFKGLMTRALNFAEMSEEVLASRLGHDKAETLVVVEPLHDTEFCFQCKFQIL